MHEYNVYIAHTSLTLNSNTLNTAQCDRNTCLISGELQSKVKAWQLPEIELRTPGLIMSRQSLSWQQPKLTIFGRSGNFTSGTSTSPLDITQLQSTGSSNQLGVMVWFPLVFQAALSFEVSCWVCLKTNSVPSSSTPKPINILATTWTEKLSGL